MHVVCETKGNVLIVRLNGELDHHIAENIRDKIDMAMERERTKHIIFDFQGINFMDSSGIGVIMGRYKKANSMGGKTVVAHVSSQLDRIFTLSGIYKIIKKYDTLELALKGL